MKISIDFLITRKHEDHEFEIELKCECNFDPGRPAPFCSNPSSPAFSDSGDPGEIELIKATVISCTDISFPEFDTSLEWLKPNQILPKEIEFTEAENESLFNKAYEDLEEPGPEYDGPDDEDLPHHWE